MAITEKQRQERTKYLGGSDAAGVLGMSRWQTPLQVWAYKTGQVEKDDKDNLAMILGRRLEEVVSEMFTEETGLKVRRSNETIFHKDYPFLGANIDRAVVGKQEGLEVKTASGWKAKEWAGEEIPQEYILQCVHYLAVTGWKRWHLAVLIGNEDFKIKVIERDEPVIKALIAKEVLFWTEFVVTKIMPGTITARDSDVLYKLYPLATPDQTKQLSDEITGLIEQRNSSIQDVKQVEQNIDRIENEIKASLGESEYGEAGKYLIRWANQSQIRLDTDKIKTEAPELYQKFGKETKSRRLTIKEIKDGKSK